MTTSVETTKLTAQDRCDRCGAQAYVKVSLASGGDLYFCAHHARAHADAISAQASSILDETDRLEPQPI